jgi:hypothetical protein
MQELKTDRGIITIKVTAAREIERLEMDARLFFWHNRPDLQREALVKIARQLCDE